MSSMFIGILKEQNMKKTTILDYPI
jgi:hypothetical protein